MLSQAIQQVLFTRPLEKEVPDIVKKYGGSLYVPAPTSTPIRNLFQYSEDLSHSSWTKSGVTVSSVITSSPSNNTSYKLVEDSTTATHRVFNNVTIVSGVIYTASFYVKNIARQFIQANLTSLSTNLRVVFDISNGTVTDANAGGTSPISSSISSITNGWYRCSVTFTATASGSVSLPIGGNSSSTGNGQSYTGSNSDAFYLWGVMVEIGSTATAYQAIAAAGTPINVDLPGTCFQDSAGTTPCTVDSVVGLMLDTANPVLNRNLFKNTGFLGGVAGSPGTVPTSVSISGAPAGMTRTLAYGITADGKAYVDVTYSGTNTSGATQYPGTQTAITTNPAVSGQTFTVSAELALVSGSWPTGAAIQALEFNSSSGYLTGSSTSIKTTVTTSTLTKVSLTRTLNNASTAYLSAYPVTFTINNNEAVNFTVRIANPQLERGSTATNFVPNTYMGYSVNQIEGNHATQSTAGYKPILRGRVKNLLLNSATLSTQNITSVAAPYTLHFTGTGTVTLSGTSTAGPLVGTGANDRVSLTFTPTAGTLTLTVSGSVTTAQLELGSKVNHYVPTTSAAASSSYGPYWLDFDGTDDRLQLGSVPFQLQDDPFMVFGNLAFLDATIHRRIFSTGNSSGTPVIQLYNTYVTGVVSVNYKDDAATSIFIASSGDSSNKAIVNSSYKYGNRKVIRKNTVLGQTNNAALSTSTNVLSYIGADMTPSNFLKGNLYFIALGKGNVSDLEITKIEKYAAKLSGAQL